MFKKATGFALAVVVATSGCDILDVENPNNLVQDDLNNAAAASAVVNGGLATLTRGIGYTHAPSATVSDEIRWIGSRDAWNQLNFGFVSSAANEFTDAAFPFINEGRWMTDEAVRLLNEVYLAENPGDATLETELGRANLHAGLAYLWVAENFDDFVLSNRTIEAPPVGEGNMSQMVDEAIRYLGEAISLSTKHGDEVTQLRAYAARARAHHYRAVWGMLNPSGSVPSNPLVSSSAADSDASWVLQRIGTAGLWRWDLEYTNASVANDFGFQVNERGELAIGLAYYSGSDWVLMDPIDDVADPRVVEQGERFLASGQYTSTTLASGAEMHLILAESALASNDTDGFALHVNHARALTTGLSDYTGQIPALDMLIHERRAALFLQNRRLNDHYRFGIPSPAWQGTSHASTNNGALQPITCIEVRANTQVSNAECG
jgi:hypothetical protein